MDYTYFSSQPSQFQYNGVANNVQNLYPIQDNDISPADAELFRGLNNIGSSFDAFGPFSPQNQFGSTAQQNANFPPRQESLQTEIQALQPPKSLSPESSHDGSMSQQFNGDAQPPAQSSIKAIAGIETLDGSLAQEPGRSSSEEKEFNSMPAQDRRKAQNRAAQRAFRERKEKHVKELEAKLASLSDASSNLQSDNERLKRELAALSTQNEILRATHTAPRSSASSNPPFQPQNFHAPSIPSPTAGPQSFTPTEFVVATGGKAAWPLKFEAYPNKRGRMLLAGAAWDMIVRDPRVGEGRVDLEDVCQRLKGRAMCDGRGPAFREEEIRQVLDECALDTDDLL